MESRAIGAELEPVAPEPVTITAKAVVGKLGVALALVEVGADHDSTKSGLRQRTVRHPSEQR